MNKKIMPLILILSLLSINFVLAECTLNGKEVPCSEMPTWFWILIGVFALVVILGLILWVWMFIDCIRFEDNKLLWILVLIFAQIIGAILYFFLAKRKRNQQIPAQPATTQPATTQPVAQ